MEGTGNLDQEKQRSNRATGLLIATHLYLWVEVDGMEEGVCQRI